MGHRRKALGIAVGALVLGLTAAIVLPIRGLWDPSMALPPDEGLRIVHPHGFSIVRPDGWGYEMATAGQARQGRGGVPVTPTADSILIFPLTKARMPEMLSVTGLPGAVPEPDATYRRISPEPHLQIKDAQAYAGQAGKYYHWFADVPTAGGLWFRISLMLPNDDLWSNPRVPDEWWSFINSFRTPEARGPRPDNGT